MFLVRRKNKRNVVYDTEGGRIVFDEISTGGHSVYTAAITNMASKEISLGQIFNIFGKDVVLKAEFVADKNFCRLSVLEGGVFTHGVGDGPTAAGHCKVVTYSDMKNVVNSYPNGECVDAVLCTSYDNKGTLTLAPYIYDWKSLSTISKSIRVFLVAIIVALVFFAVKTSGVKDFSFLVFLLVKDNISTLISYLLL